LDLFNDRLQLVKSKASATEFNKDYLKWLRIEANTLKKATEKALAEGISIGKQEGISIGEARGIEKGKAKKAIEIAKAMLLDGDAIEKIGKITGLTTKQIEKLK